MEAVRGFGSASVIEFHVLFSQLFFALPAFRGLFRDRDFDGALEVVGCGMGSRWLEGASVCNGLL